MSKNQTMMILNTIYKAIIAISLLLLTSNCARIASPSGGIKDEFPPVVKNSKPEANALGYSKDKVRIYFDEIVVLKGLNDNFLVSPPTATKPMVSAYGKELSVEFEDTLQSNTTYTLYFGNAIADNNEGNILPNYTFSFSTGYVMDTMRLQGYVVNSETLNPEAGIIVGIYSNFSDTAFTHSVPVRIAKTNKEGWFSVNNVKPGKYMVRALGEMDNDFRFNQPGELIAYSEDVFETSQETITLMDSIFLDSIGEDDEHHLIFKELRPRDTIMYYPDNILLMSFKEYHPFQTLKEKNRKQEDRLEFVFLDKITAEPRIALLADTTIADWYIPEYSEDSLALTYWVKDTALIKLDTIAVLFDYQVTDTLEQYVWKRDTLNMRFKRKKKSARQKRKEASQEEKDKEDGKVKKTPALKLTLSPGTSVPFFQDLILTSPQPLASVDPSAVHLQEVVNDSTYVDLKYVFAKDKVIPRSYRLTYNWDQEKTYFLRIDSASFYGIYGLTNDSIGQKISIIGEDKFSNIFVNVKNLRSNAVVQLLSASEEVLFTAKVDANNTEAAFYYLKPNKYYVSLFYDDNNNGEWDPGCYEEKRQPEELYFFPKVIQAKAYYDMEEDWDLDALPVLDQKPLELRNKKKKK